MQTSRVEFRADGSGAAAQPARWLSRSPEVVRAPDQDATTRVRVVHAMPLIASGIRAVIARTSDFQLVPETSKGVPDVLIADVDTGLRALGDGTPCRCVLVVGQDDGEAVIRKALAQGVRGFLLLTCGFDELTMAVKALAAGGTALAPRVASRIAQSISSDALTERELEVLRLLAEGFADKAIARELLIALGTVKSHVRSILGKLGANRRTEAVAIAQRRGLIM
ncbi:MAG TPA: response regulator transcription factor [Polyangiales bacterium]|nr:response regulator transcription factor [Polyangiales bacterium]